MIELACQIPFSLFSTFKAIDMAGHGNCYGDAVTQGSPNNVAELKDLKLQVLKARHLNRQSELKVEVIKATIYEIEIFYPKIKVIRRRNGAGKDGFILSAENVLLSAA